MKVKVIRMSDIGKCPKHSLMPDHYHDDGTCRCSEREAAAREVREKEAAEDARTRTLYAEHAAALATHPLDVPRLRAAKKAIDDHEEAT